MIVSREDEVEMAVAASGDGSYLVEADTVLVVSDDAYWLYTDPAPFRQHKIHVPEPVCECLKMSDDLSDEDTLSFLADELNEQGERQIVFYGFVGPVPADTPRIIVNPGMIDDFVAELRWAGMSKVFVTRHEYCDGPLSADRKRVFRSSLRLC